MDVLHGLRHLRCQESPVATVSSRCCSASGVWWISTRCGGCAAGAGRLWTGAAAQTDSRGPTGP